MVGRGVVSMLLIKRVDFEGQGGELCPTNRMGTSFTQLRAEVCHGWNGKHALEALDYSRTYIIDVKFDLD